MWPWEHAIVGYLAYSLFSRAYFREPPGERETSLVVLASILPDLIDKPLAWEFGVFRSGHALGHSLLFAVVLAVAAGLLARARGDGRAGVAVGIGYLLHLVGDAAPIYVRSGTWTVEHLLWPVVVVKSTAPPAGILAGVRRNLLPYLERLAAAEPTPYLMLQLGLASGAVLLWLLDGTPGPRGVYAGVRRTCSTVVHYATPG